MLILFCLLNFFAQTHDTSVAISNIEKELGSNRKSVSEILTDTSYMYLHSLTSFRDVIRRNAKAEEISIVSKFEPGVRTVINGVVTNSSGNPLKNILIYFYHTSDKGWYSDTGVHILLNEGDHRHARLFGYVKTDKEGKFRINTIRPNGYPKTDLAAHIHIQM